MLSGFAEGIFFAVQCFILQLTGVRETERWQSETAKTVTLQERYNESRPLSRAGLRPVRRGYKTLIPSMRWMKWAGIAAAVLLLVSSFLPWIVIESRQIRVTGMGAEGTNFGKPAYFHMAMAVLFIMLSFIPRVWAKRTNLVVVAMNFAWGVRNYFVLSRCEAGECPDRQLGLFLALTGTGVMMLAALFPDMKLPENKTLPE